MREKQKGAEETRGEEKKEQGGAAGHWDKGWQRAQRNPAAKGENKVMEKQKQIHGKKHEEKHEVRGSKSRARGNMD